MVERPSQEAGTFSKRDERDPNFSPPSQAAEMTLSRAPALSEPPLLPGSASPVHGRQDHSPGRGLRSSAYTAPNTPCPQLGVFPIRAYMGTGCMRVGGNPSPSQNPVPSSASLRASASAARRRPAPGPRPASCRPAAGPGASRRRRAGAGRRAASP